MQGDEKDFLRIGADAVMKPIANLMERLFGGAVDEIGGMWQDSLKFKRRSRQVKLMRELETQIGNAGFTPQPIPEKIWIPALQAALMNDDDSLQEKFAALLANASNQETAESVEPMFVSILSDLTPKQALFLDKLHEYEVNKRQNRPPQVSPGLPGEFLLALYGKNGMSRIKNLGALTHGSPPAYVADYQRDVEEFQITLQSLKRHQLIEAIVKIGNIDHGPEHTVRAGEKLFLAEQFRISSLGNAFLKACRPPKRKRR